MTHHGDTCCCHACWRHGDGHGTGNMAPSSLCQGRDWWEALPAPCAVAVGGLHAGGSCHPGGLAPDLRQGRQPLLCHAWGAPFAHVMSYPAPRVGYAGPTWCSLWGSSVQPGRIWHRHRLIILVPDHMHEEPFNPFFQRPHSATEHFKLLGWKEDVEHPYYDPTGLHILLRVLKSCLESIQNIENLRCALRHCPENIFCQWRVWTVHSPPVKPSLPA